MAVSVTSWVALLESDQQEEIRFRLWESIESERIYESDEISSLVDDGMDSRICDLMDTINIFQLEATSIKE